MRLLLELLQSHGPYRYKYGRGGRMCLSWESEMFVNDNIRKCVFFIGSKKGDSYQIRATGFLLMHPVEGARCWALYAVSAAHCVENAHSHSDDGRVYLFTNSNDNRYEPISTEFASWEIHDDQVTDVAVLPLDWSDEFVETHGQLAIGSDQFLGKEAMDTLRVSPGDELYFPGLFVRVPGESLNIPILRTGTLAALASESIRTVRGMTPAHLAEIRSIGGHSGSPVFLHINTADRLFPIRKEPEVKRLLNELAGVPPFLGLIHGYIPMRRDQFSTDITGDSTEHSLSCDHRTEDFNSGIAVIVPATKILEVLNQKRLVDLRLLARNRQYEQHGGTVET